MDGFAALADPTRRRIVELVAVGPRAAGEIAEQFTVSRPAISQHLGVLVAGGILKVETYGRRRLYSLDQVALEVPLNWLEAQRHRWNCALDRLQDEIDKNGPER